MIYHRFCNKSRSTDATSVTGTLVFSGIRVAQSLAFNVVFCDKCLRIPKGNSEAANPRRAANTMAKQDQ